MTACSSECVYLKNCIVRQSGEVKFNHHPPLFMPLHFYSSLYHRYTFILQWTFIHGFKIISIKRKSSSSEHESKDKILHQLPTVILYPRITYKLDPRLFLV